MPALWWSFPMALWFLLGLTARALHPGSPPETWTCEYSCLRFVSCFAKSPPSKFDGLEPLGGENIMFSDHFAHRPNLRSKNFHEPWGRKLSFVDNLEMQKPQGETNKKQACCSYAAKCLLMKLLFLICCSLLFPPSKFGWPGAFGRYKHLVCKSQKSLKS